jgi:hypothetical protein
MLTTLQAIDLSPWPRTSFYRHIPIIMAVFFAGMFLSWYIPNRIWGGKGSTAGFSVLIAMLIGIAITFSIVFSMFYIP